MRFEAAIPNYPITVESTYPQSVPVKAGLPRFVEIVVAIAGLIICSPFLALAAVAVSLTSRGPILFRQQRVGQGGRTFILYKLRTMRVKHEGPQVTLRDDTRVTSVGRFLRKTKLDELPQLFNVLKGEISLVGPRPEVPLNVDLENPIWNRVLEVKPGITDPMTLRLRNEEELLAQVIGNREDFYLTNLQPFKLEAYLTYLQDRSWWSDVKVLWKSSVVVVFPSRVPPLTVNEILTSVSSSSSANRSLP
jgi:lipopolysaccharide/colanic/teichoic acid biosynthesis glycosyltransferase